jgi:steroid delta-isomerase-like uncharacterized protein
MTEADRDLGRRWFDLVWNQGKREAIAAMLAPDAVIHDGGIDSNGPEGFYPFFDRMHATFTEVHIHVEDMFADKDKICVRWSFTGKHAGAGLGIPPSSKKVHITGISILRIAGGRLLEGWQNWDMLGMLEQINGAPKSATYIGAP